MTAPTSPSSPRPDLDEAQEQFSAILHQCARSWRLALDRRLRPLGFSQPAWLLLSTLAREEGITQRDLADRLGIEGPTLVGLLDRLERDGLVERRPSDTDRRAKTVHMLAKGIERLQVIQRTAAALRHEMLHGVGTPQLVGVTEFLTALRGKIEAL